MILFQNHTLLPLTVHLFKRETIEEMFQFISENHIEPSISMIFTLDEISEAHKYQETDKAKGKVVVTID